MAHTERLFSPKELAEIAGVSPATIRREVARGRLRGVRIGERPLIRVPESAWLEYLGRSATRRRDDSGSLPRPIPDQHFYQREGKRGPGLDDGVRRASLLVDHPYLARVAFTGALATELFAFLVLFGRVPAFVLGCGLIFMHVMIEIVMEVPFRSSIHVLLVFAVNVPYLLTLAIDLF